MVRDDGDQRLMRRFTTSFLAAALLGIAVAGSALAGGPPSPGFYIDGTLYATVGTPTDFFGTGAPAHTYDRIYALGNGLTNVAEAKPGDRDFNGGRWLVFPVSWNATPYQITSDADLFAARDAGDLTIGADPVKAFFCSVQRIRD